ncbi:DNA alkylation repair protein [uncultured Helicobacter sp.]|uniref:DNA alkylation repair protein n=1 Tax=uncultured Helicobacter sp. TaxID=175537 RepID=UPI0026036BCF|nr:DNA alkylation repair protein [uncultured Helicobacter sp.]
MQPLMRSLQKSIKLSLRQELLALRDLRHQNFCAKLLPNLEKSKIIGVKTKSIKDLAKHILKTSLADYLNDSTSHIYFEENLLEGYVLALYLQKQWNPKLLHSFVLRLDNWWVCDCFCAALKNLNETHLWELVTPYLNAQSPYVLRFGIVMLLKTQEISKALLYLSKIKHENYYVKMAIAWAVCVYFTKDSNIVLEFLENKSFTTWIHNKAIQKIRESLRVKLKDKQRVKALIIRNI